MIKKMMKFLKMKVMNRNLINKNRITKRNKQNINIMIVMNHKMKVLKMMIVLKKEKIKRKIRKKFRIIIIK